MNWPQSYTTDRFGAILLASRSADHLYGAATMQLAMIGLGRMGGNMVQRLLQGGHEVVVYDQSADAVKASAATGSKAAKDIADLVRQLSPRRVVWVMVPAGDP